jgi:UrcA family protein
MENAMKTINIAGCILGLVSASTAAAPVVVEGHRAPAQEYVTERVSFADLDISSQAGLDTLRGRIHAAATRVCASNNPEPLVARIESLGCNRRAMTDSYAQMDRILTARSAGTAVAAAAISVTSR